MSKIKTFSEIVNNMIERLKISQPNLDTKIGTVSRDLFIDIQADEIQKLYNLMSIISSKQSFATASGRDLELIARNFGISRNTGSLSSGLVVFTTTNLNSDISIPEGTEVSTRSGISFRTIGSYVFSPTQRNIYSSNASRLRNFLNKAGNRDSYAIEVPVQAVSRGTRSNVSPFQIVQNNGPLELNVVNTQATSGGANSESDSSFRARIFSLFNGSNTGTSIGYKNAALGTSGVVDALVVEPGSSLMLRDGSEVISSNDGNLSVINSGTGGKVDIYILGSDLIQVTESFVFRDKSSENNISDDKNDLILGYSNQDLLKTNLQRRKDAYEKGNFPLQPVGSIVSVQGSLSGRLLEEGFDNANFRLVKDYNPDTGGSPFGQDKIKFISDKKFISEEQITKGKTSAGDNIKFFNIKNIDSVYQDILLSNQSATVNSDDRSIITLRNHPVVSISSIRNINTGEQYGHTSLNFEEGLNNSGEIKIYGNKLPTVGEDVSVTYTCRFYFDESINFQSRYNYYFSNENISDKIYWGSNDYIEREEVFAQRNSDDSSYIADLSNKVEDIICAYSFDSESDIEVKKDDLGFYIDLSNTIKNIIRIINLDKVDISINYKNNLIIKNSRLYFPKEIILSEGEVLKVEYNKTDFFNLESGSGIFYDNRVVFPSDNSLSDENLFLKISSIVDSGSPIYFDYISLKENIFSSVQLSEFPVVGSEQSNALFSSSGQIQESYQPVEYNFDIGQALSVNRFSPCRFGISIESEFANGLLRISGSSFTKLSVEVMGSVFDGSSFDLSGAIKEFIGKSYVPDYIKICKVSRVSLDGKEYDLKGYELSNNIFDNYFSVQNENLNNYTFKILPTKNNLSISHSTGSVFSIDFYIENTEDFEDIKYISSDLKYTNKLFSKINSLDIVSGFRNQEGSLDGLASLYRLDKPQLGTSYFADYNFISPIQGERITVNYTTNRLIIDTSRSIESVRTITSDVLVKEAEAIIVDCAAKIVISEELSESFNVVLENVTSQITNSLNSSQLGGSISISDLVSAASSVSGVEAISIAKFCESGDSGKLSFIKALDNQTIIPGTIDVIRVSRRNFS